MGKDVFGMLGGGWLENGVANILCSPKGNADSFSIIIITNGFILFRQVVR